MVRCFLGRRLLSLLILGITWSDITDASARDLRPGTEKSNREVLKDLIRLGFCRQSDGDNCDGMGAVNHVWLETKSKPIYTVEAMLFLGISKSNKRADRAKKSAVRLVHYFMPNWVGSEQWIARKFEISRNVTCPQITRYGGFTVVLAQQIVNAEEGTFISLVITRSKTPGKVTSTLAWSGCNLVTGRYDDR